MEVPETSDADQAVADYYQRPPITNDLKRLGVRTIHIPKARPAHCDTVSVQASTQLVLPNPDNRPAHYESCWRRRAREALKLTRLPQTNVLHWTRD